MRIFTHFHEITPAQFRRPVVAVGVFDGVHLGHKAILWDIDRVAGEVDGEGVVMTFDRHPSSILQGFEPPRIHTIPHRLLILERLHAENVIVVPFDEAMAEMTAERFMREILKERLGAVGLIMGPGNNFGKGGKGDAVLAAKLGEKYGIRVVATERVSVRGQEISSTALRGAILDGDLDLAQAMVGKPFTLLGKVISGAGRGRKLGFPTANLDVAGEILPPRGVYLGKTVFQRRIYRSMINIGVRPTFKGGETTVEVHLLDFFGDLYGLTIEVSLLQWHRAEREFRGPDDLAAQLRKDREAARFVGAPAEEG